jgi:siderophore synthetase component
MTDPLHEGTPREVAEHAHLEALIRCWLRETGIAVSEGPLRIDLPATGLALVTEVTHRSSTDLHRFGPVRLARGLADLGPADPVVATALITTEIAGDGADLIERTAESVRRVTTFVEYLHGNPRAPEGFLDAEQALVLGHLMHPAPKSRDGISAADLARYSPELRGSFPLHWFAVDESLVLHDEVEGADTFELLSSLSGLQRPPGKVLVPAHPWQARDVLSRPGVAEMVEYLGESGPSWWPTSSLRTVYRPDVPVMLKLSLGLRITNSRREFIRATLVRGPEIHRLLATGYASATEQAYPSLSIVRDPAWLSVGEPDKSGLAVAVREVPADIDSLRPLVGLLAPRPGRGCSRLGEIVGSLGDAAEWVADYTDKVLVPMLHLYARTGIGLEAHQQNTLVRLDSVGRVVGAAFRDNEGYYLASSFLPGLLDHLGLTESTLAVVDDKIVDERLSYYLLRNQALAVVGCLGAEGLADERELLGVVVDRLRAALPTLAAAGPDGDRLANRWLSSDTLPCKGNLLTRLHGIDEVLAPLDAQSVYLEAPNPLREAIG